MLNGVPAESVVITGLGVVTPLGQTVDELWQALMAGHCASRPWEDLKEQGFRISTACRVADFAAPDEQRGQFMAIAAARQAREQARLPQDRPVGVFVGSTMGESAAFEQTAEGRAFDLGQSSIQIFPKAVQTALGLEGPLRAYGTACAAGNYAIGAAARAIQSGQLDYAIAGGVEPFSRIAMVGFSRSRAMAADYCRPFDKDRSGMQLGEAAAFVVLESERAARARGVTPLARVHSLGLSCDAYHPTAPRPDGSGMAAAMSQALQMGGVAPGDIDWVCAHGSGTRASDAAESQALASLFEHRPAISGIKGALGHALGAATAVQAVVVTLGLQQQCIPPTVNFRGLEPESRLDMVAEPRSVPGLRRALSCGYAFGGINSALLMEAV